MPGGAHDAVERRELRAPAKKGIGAGRTGDEDCGVTRAARRWASINRNASDTLYGSDDFTHGNAVAGAEVYSKALSVGVGSCRIEITQGGPAKIVGAAVPIEGTLDEELGLAVGIHGQLRVIFRNGNHIWDTVDRAAGRKDEAADSCVEEGLQEVEGTDHVVLKVAARFVHGFADVGVRGKMYGSGDVVLPDGVLKGTAIRNVRFDERAPLNGPPMSCG